jgi:MYXO-CTERM domain-containing protein
MGGWRRKELRAAAASRLVLPSFALLAACTVDSHGGPPAERTATVASALTKKVSFATAAIDLPYTKCLHGVAVADLDGDGHLDVALANGLYSVPQFYVQPSLEVRFGAGDGTFHSALSFPYEYYNVESVQIADMDNDGALDVVGTTSNEELDILWGDGHGHFTSSRYQIWSQSGVTLADANHDGLLDLVMGAAYLNDGARNFVFKSPVNWGTSTSTLHAVGAGDLNGDGNIDVLATFDDLNALSTVQIALGRGDGTFGSLSTISLASAGALPTSPVLADFNGDHALDLALSEVDLDQVVVMLGDGHASFGTQTVVASGLGAIGLLAVDLDQDGKLDLLTGNGNSDSTSVLFGKGDGTFAAAVDYGTGEDTQGLAVADFNEDCVPDLAIGNAGTTSGDHGTFAVALGDGKGTIAASRAYPVGSYGASVVTADFDGDNKPDTVLERDDGFAAAVDVYLSTKGSSFETFAEYGLTSGLSALGTADLDGDGTPDIYSANFTMGTVTVLYNDRSGGFPNWSTTQVTTSNTYDVATADMNGDNALDLVVLEGTQISVWQGGSGATDAGSASDTGGALDGGAAADAGGTAFSAATTFTVPASGERITTGDINGDGKPDVIASDPSSYVIRTFTNDGTKLTAGPTYGTIAAPHYLRLVDLNGDGARDIVAATSDIISATSEAGADNGGVDVLLNDGDGGFGTAVHTRAGSSTTTLDLADFNGDGVMDVVVAGSAGGYGVALINDGTGTLTPSPPLVGGESTYGIAAADFNADGRPDVLLSDYYTNMLYLVLNEGTPAADAGTRHCPPDAGHADAAADAPSDAVAADASAESAVDASPDSLASNPQPDAAPPDSGTDAADDAATMAPTDSDGFAESGVDDATTDVFGATAADASPAQDAGPVDDDGVDSFAGGADADASAEDATDANDSASDGHADASTPGVDASTGSYDGAMDAPALEARSGDSSGCGCMTAGAPSSPIGGLGAITLAIAVSIRRRRRKTTVVVSANDGG